jgi:signal transduction histidine kinase
LAHQLRNTATGAKLAIELYMVGLGDRGSEELDVAVRQLKLMETNLRRFIDLGKPEAAANRTFELTALIHEAIDLRRPQADHAGTRLTMTIPGAAFEMVGDPDQIRDALLNLIGNAIEAAGASGEVDVEAACPDGASVWIAIRDNGPGPPARIADRLFQPFITGKPEGIGLGLAVARHAIERHQGTLAWRREGERTVFVITLSRRNSDEAAQFRPCEAST